MIPLAATPFRIVLLGPPASGKGTQGRRLAAALGLGYLSTGALLREQVETQTALGQLAMPMLARGEYLPDDLMCPILAEWLAHQATGWVLDGFPRSLPQAVFLDRWLTESGQTLSAAVSLEVPEELRLSRIKGRVECPGCRWSGQRVELISPNLCPVCRSPATSRADDSEQNFLSRHAEFVALTQPVIHYYQHAAKLHSITASAPQEQVAAQILACFPSPA